MVSSNISLANLSFSFCLADFNNIVFLAIVYQFHHCIYSGLNCCDFKLLSEVNLSNICTRASAANKCEINKNKKCDNSFIYLAPKLWNRLDNTITSFADPCEFYSLALKHIFN